MASRSRSSLQLEWGSSHSDRNADPVKQDAGVTKPRQLADDRQRQRMLRCADPRHHQALSLRETSSGQQLPDFMELTCDFLQLALQVVAHGFHCGRGQFSFDGETNHMEVFFVAHQHAVHFDLLSLGILR